MELLNDNENMRFSLGSDGSLTFDLNGADSTFELATGGGLSFSLNVGETLTYNLGNPSDISVDLETPTVVGVDYYDESYEVTPKTYEQKLETKRKFLTDDITVLEIPYFETSNDSDGMTVYIANTMA